MTQVALPEPDPSPELATNAPDAVAEPDPEPDWPAVTPPGDAGE